MMAASNTEECLLELRGRTIVGVLMNAFPITRRDRDEFTKTLLLDDGTGITWNHRGSFWRESADDVKRALDLRVKELEKAQDAMRRILEAAGAGRKQADQKGAE